MIMKILLHIQTVRGIFAYFYSHLSLETVFPSCKLTQNYYINISTSFSWKLVYLILNRPPSHSPTIIPCLKDYPHNLPLPNLRWIVNNLEVQPRLLFKKNPSFFLNQEKLRSPARAIFKNSKISLWTGKNFELQPKPNTPKSQFGKSLGPKLSFVVDKMGNLHKIRLLTFQTQWIRYFIHYLKF